VDDLICVRILPQIAVEMRFMNIFALSASIPWTLTCPPPVNVLDDMMNFYTVSLLRYPERTCCAFWLLANVVTMMPSLLNLRHSALSLSSNGTWIHLRTFQTKKALYANYKNKWNQCRFQ
jgi:hypothetical protein